MRRVTGQEDPTHPVGRHLALVAVEPGQPPRVVHTEIAAKRSPSDLADLGQIRRRGILHLIVPVPGEDPIPTLAERGHEGETVAHSVHREHVVRRGAQPYVRQHDRLRATGK
jgi:hypothetical protein